MMQLYEVIGYYAQKRAGKRKKVVRSYRWVVVTTETLANLPQLLGLAEPCEGCDYRIYYIMDVPEKSLCSLLPDYQADALRRSFGANAYRLKFLHTEDVSKAIAEARLEYLEENYGQMQPVSTNRRRLELPNEDL